MQINSLKNILTFFLTLACVCTLSQDETANTFIDFEILGIQTVPNYSKFPEANAGMGAFVSFGKYHSTPQKSWAQYYNYPETGVSFGITNYGNKDILGHGFHFSSFVTRNVNRQKQRAWQFRIGIGFSYFNRPYHATDNPENEVIGSDITWNFHVYLYRNLITTPKSILKFGGGYLHDSNGHYTLPNYGLNTAALSLSYQFFKEALPTEPLPRWERNEENLKKYNLLDLRMGVGAHEFGSTAGPKGGPKKPVYTFSAAVARVFRKHVKVKAGFAYRWYQHYYDYIQTEQLVEYADNPGWNASNIYFFLGVEYYMRHVSLDIEAGINMHKPFYKEFYQLFEPSHDLNFYTKNLFPSRLCVRVYLFEPSTEPLNNFFFSGSINANFGQADYTGFSVGFVRKFLN